MAYDEATRHLTLTADSTLASYTGVPGVPGSADPNYGPAFFRFVKVVGRKQVGRATVGGANSAKIIGVCYSKPQVVGEACTVVIRGASMVLAGGAFVAGDLITTDSTGRAVKSADATFADVLGIAIEDSSGQNTLSTVLLRTT